MSNLFPDSPRESCGCPEEKRDRNWLWSDCEVSGHEEGCYVVMCRSCDLWSSDCDEDWKAIPADWK